MKYHFIAIGGSAMHNLALALHDTGHQITGSDDALYEPAKSRLEHSNLAPSTLGFDASNVPDDCDAVILGMHAKPHNVELLAAQERGLRIYSYPEFIYEQSKQKTRVVIAGSHGKTTITSMILHVMRYHDKEIDYLVGAQLDGFDRMVRLSEDADFMLIEGDEYLSSAIDRRPKFLWYQPNIALLSGISWDHINVFQTEEIYVDQFRQFLESIVPGGSLTYYSNDPVVKSLAEGLSVPIRKFSYADAAHEISGDQTHLLTEEGPLVVSIFGAHNMANIEGARWICQQLGVDTADFYEAIASFKGAAKRLEPIASNRALVFKDFAHAPSKVRATCAAVKAQFTQLKLHAFLELHTYSSLTPEFITNYRGALTGAETALVLYDTEAIALKGMQPLSELFLKEAFGRDDLKVATSREALFQQIDKVNDKNSVILMMSSGNFARFDFGYFKGI